MLNNKTFLVFLLKALLIYGVLSFPMPLTDKGYGSFYRALCKPFFNTFRTNGFVWFSTGSKDAYTQVNIGNYNQVNKRGQTTTSMTEVNTRFRGYLPTILFFSLLLASPVPWRRKIFSAVIGLLLLNLLILFKQWLGLLSICFENPWLQLFSPAGLKKEIFLVLSKIFIKASGTLLYFTVAIWALVTFRKKDFLLNPVK